MKTACFLVACLSFLTTVSGSAGAAEVTGCTIMTTEPTDKALYKMMGKYNSKAEAEKAIASMKQC